jgi:acyl-lipid omega-6 desaturase (Delta-12 desaturase)
MTAVTDLDKLPWQKFVSPFARANARTATWQIINSVVPFVALWVAMVYALSVSYWLMLPLAILAAGFWIRIFIIFHDACHGSFFKSKRANETTGIITGILTLTPYYHWRHDHAIHHATAGNIDKRYTGDVPTMTVAEYRAAPWYSKIGYRIMRSPFILFTVGAPIMFILVHRVVPFKADPRERWSVVYTDLAIAALVVALGLWMGWAPFAIIFLTMSVPATIIGVWLFYVQHQYEGVYWETKDRWSFVRASLQGSSFYKLPRLLQWFTGSIGFHHIHHLSPKVPNYHLEACYKANPAFHVKPLGIIESLKGMRLHLIDERTRQLVGWDALRR